MCRRGYCTLSDRNSMQPIDQVRDPQNWRMCITRDQLSDSPTLYIVASPIGNMKDITLRALMVLDGVDLILCEDTRKSAMLLSHYGIQTQKKSYRIHQQDSDNNVAIDRLLKGGRLAFLSDAGTPGICDPGSSLVRMVRMQCPEVEIIPIPGASALSSALGISGWQTNPCQFFGFLPLKKGKRQKLIDGMSQYEGTCVMYESVHRIESTLLALRPLNFQRDIMILREMTKLYEETIFFKQDSDDTLWENMILHLRKKGEFTIMIGPKK